VVETKERLLVEKLKSRGSLFNIQADEEQHASHQKQLLDKFMQSPKDRFKHQLASNKPAEIVLQKVA
jgi:hypothetical protein